MKTISLTISDETLRDGEQQAGLFFLQETKQTLAHLIAQVGVNQIAIMPAIHETEEDLAKILISEGLSSKITASTMMDKKFIDQSKACGVERIILFHAVSDRLLFLRDPEIRRSPSFQAKTVDDDIPEAVIYRCRQNMIDKVLKNLLYAISLGLKVDFAAEDASRADFNFLVDCICAFRPYIGHFLLCDTVGILSPEKCFVWIHDLLEYSNHASLGVHFHNDLGLALENTIQAVLAGASVISGTFGGIGERAGNVALEQVLNGLRVRFGWEVEEINYDAITKVTNYLEQVGAKASPPYSKKARRQETGVHINSLLQDPKSYSIMPYEKLEIWFGKCSGASNFQYLFEKYLLKPLTKKEYENMRSAIKAISIQQKRCFSTEETLDLLQRGVLNV